MLENRKTTILFIFFTVLLIYISRLLYLQVIDDRYRSLGSSNAIRKNIQIPLRGQIYDRNGKLLVANVEVYDMYVTPRKVKPMDTLTFCNLFGITRKFFDSTMRVAKEYSVNKASIFIRQLSKEDYAKVADAMVNFSGFNFEQSFFRTYPAATMANALGYIGELSKTQYEAQGDNKYYRKGDYIGLTGLEKEYELDLRGQKGTRFTLVNVKGEEKGAYGGGSFDTLAVIGKDLHSTVDMGLQQFADSLFQNKVGGVVAIEPNTGEILTLGSYPTYDPNELSGKLFSAKFRELSKNPDKPLINRVTNSFYRPGSTFKLVQAAVALQEGVITPTTSFTGYPSPMACHGHSALHTANLHNAIQSSCNPYFFNVFKKIIGNNNESNPFISAREGLAVWHTMMEKFGFGIKLGIDLPGEKAGLLPSVERYDKVYGKNEWKFSNIYSLSIGEGELGVNVLKLANLCAALANRGYWVTPHLIKGVGQPKGGVKPDLVKVHQTGVEARYFEPVVNGMYAVVESGTGRVARIEGIEVCGKTGTSQNKKGGDHSLFIAFAPRVNPKIAIAVVVENGIWGARAAAPIASLLIEKYLNGQVKRKEYAVQIMNTSYRTTAASKGQQPKNLTPEN
ncbi:penicillin-binding transpeptidase domain-containing protein [Emticicia sp. TH156]|uniref:penicillin-binding transpeptidase domain-containing protein n=1 Tax=Emticicia sp. TH156 TaxID=2067454 RepID=UPI000C79351F|nr:penicillin-binding transpeptidase domain-containing protein [Emticicia sp. TH156]PLK45393.1 peptidoglycan glycosyltransferase [Emticicia sp. TH156]